MHVHIHDQVVDLPQEVVDAISTHVSFEEVPAAAPEVEVAEAPVAPEEAPAEAPAAEEAPVQE